MPNIINTKPPRQPFNTDAAHTFLEIKQVELRAPDLKPKSKKIPSIFRRKPMIKRHSLSSPLQIEMKESIPQNVVEMII
jgi:hypothetical protein